jgi:hypothetical protein
MEMGKTGNEVEATLGIALDLGVREVITNENEDEVWRAEKRSATIGLLTHKSMWRAES